MNTLVTGGAGFIGSHLAERLISAGHRVTVLDNLYSGRMTNLPKSPRVKFIRIDISRKTKRLSDAFARIDWVFHLAGKADIVPSILDPIGYYETNVTGTVHVLEAARQHRVQRFLYAASASCYGIPTTIPTPETAPISPQYPYALTKYLGEEYVLHWGKTYGLPVISLRLFNVYGPRSRTSGAYGAVFGTFLAQKLAGKPLTIVGDGTQTRDFTYVTDVADAMMTAAASGVRGEIMNVGSGREYSVNALADLIGGKAVHIPKRPGEPDRTRADIRKIRRLLGWRPKVAFADGVAVLLSNIDYWRRAPVWTKASIGRATKEWFRYLR